MPTSEQKDFNTNTLSSIVIHNPTEAAQLLKITPAEKENTIPLPLKLFPKKSDIRKDIGGMWELNRQLCDILDSARVWWDPFITRAIQEKTKEIIKIVKRIIEKHVSSSSSMNVVSSWRSGISNSSSSKVLNHIERLIKQDITVPVLGGTLIEEVIQEGRVNLDLLDLEARCDYLISECAQLIKSFKSGSKERHKSNIVKLIEIIATAMFLLEQKENSLDDTISNYGDSYSFPPNRKAIVDAYVCEQRYNLSLTEPKLMTDEKTIIEESLQKLLSEEEANREQILTSQIAAFQEIAKTEESLQKLLSEEEAARKLILTSQRTEFQLAKNRFNLESKEIEEVLNKKPKEKQKPLLTPFL